MLLLFLVLQTLCYSLTKGKHILVTVSRLCRILVSNPLSLCGDHLNRGSELRKRKPVDLVALSIFVSEQTYYGLPVAQYLILHPLRIPLSKVGIMLYHRSFPHLH